jgi:butyryl-CoA dehydrogenase
MVFAEEVRTTLARAQKAGLDGATLDRALGELIETTRSLGARGLGGDVDGMLLHSADYLAMFSIVAVGWQWLLQATVATEALAAGRGAREFYEGKRAAAQYWLRTEVPRVTHLASLCASAEDSYARCKPEWL